MGVVGGVIYPAYQRFADDPKYAEDVFTGILRYNRVYETRRWHRAGANWWDCTYAIVEIPKTASMDPPTKGYEGRPWFLRFGGDWQPTPLAPLGSTTRDALGFCAKYWPEPLVEHLTKATTEPGHYAVRDQVGETISIYAPKLGIAARIRFGD